MDATFGADWPDIEILSLDAYTGSLNDFLLGAPDLRNYTAICFALVAPFSRGNVTITSNDTAIHPVVNPNWLTDPRDQEVAVAAFKRARVIFESASMRPILLGAEAYPGIGVDTNEEILQIIKTSSSTIHHAAGTNRMGLANDTMAVVDSRGWLDPAKVNIINMKCTARVFGVNALRVVDASVFPILPPGHPQATVCQSPYYSPFQAADLM